jgi:23S rRNA pseudouridine2605 synthase
MPTDRLQKIIAQSGLMSRRKAEEAITEGRVAIDGVVHSEMGRVVDPSIEKITIDGKPLPEIIEKKTYLFYKPKGVVTTKSDPEGRPTVMDYFKDEPGLNPVGRLDFDSEGLLLMTHDGDLLLKLTHPRYGHQKVYEVEVEGVPKPGYLYKLVHKVVLSDGPGKFDDLKVLRDQQEFLVTVSEGRNRFVRRMFGEMNLAVTKLKRTRMGEYELGDLKPGEKRLLVHPAIAPRAPVPSR